MNRSVEEVKGSAMLELEKKLRLLLDNDSEDLLANVRLGALLIAKGDVAESLKPLSKAVLLDPNAENYYNLGVSLHLNKNYSDALTMYQEAEKLNPQKSEIHSNMGCVYRDLQQFGAALSEYQKCIALNPNNYIEYLNFTSVLINLKKYEDALEIIEYAIPRLSGEHHIKALCMKADVLNILGRRQEVQECHSALSKIAADNPDVLCMIAFQNLKDGNYQDGLRLFENRWLTQTEGLIITKFDQPKWLGDFSIDGKTLLVHVEQGFGDTIQFSRYIPLLKPFKARVIFCVQKALVDVFKELEGVDHLICIDDPKPAFDCYVPLMSLPLIFKTTPETIPHVMPYIRADIEKSQQWKQRLAEVSGHKKNIGLVWNGGLRREQPELFGTNDRRNMPIEHLVTLAQVDANFYSLQKGEPAESEFKQLMKGHWSGPHIIDYSHYLSDFTQTAAFIDHLDLIISVDTSTAHLAAAMGKPVWLLNRFDTCWRWFEGIDHSPWYPSMKIYRQPHANDWQSVMQQVKDDLMSWI